MKNFILVCLLCIAAAPGLLAQREYSNWYFGKYVGVTFNTPTNEPIFLPNNKLSQFEGCATISDKNGSLLLYSNGEYVLNKNGAYLNLGNPLSGHQSSSQSAFLLQKPGSTNLYYLFTTDAGEYTGETNSGIHYSVIDINANLGQGGFVEFNVPLVPQASEQLSATYHNNGTDIWVVGRGWKNNNFYAFLVTKNGIVDTVITSIGFTRSNDFHTIGCLKFSQRGNLAVAPVYDEQFIELYRFDTQTGEFYNRLQIDMPGNVTLYGAEFSPNGKVLYISSSKNSFGIYSVYQLDISDYNKASIESSILKLAYKAGHVGTLQRGLNNKIYLASLNVPALHSIENPDVLGSNCGFTERKINLLDSMSQLGLPQTLKSAENLKVYALCEGSSVTLDPEDFLFDTTRYEHSFKWTGPNNFESFAPRPVLTDLQLIDSGNYELKVTYNIDGSPLTKNFNIYIRVGAHIPFKIKGIDTICKGGVTIFTSDTINSFFSYRWNTGRRQPFISVTEAGKYTLYMTNQFGCVDSASVNLTVLTAPKAVILGDRIICRNNSVTLTSANTADDITYLWSTGETTPSINVDKPGKYKLVITNRKGCRDSSEKVIVKYEKMTVSIKGDTILCTPGSALLKAEITPLDTNLTYSYLWSTGETGSAINITKAGLYYVGVTIESNCTYSDSILITKFDRPKLNLTVRDSNKICAGEFLMADITDIENNVNYRWSDGSKIFPRKISVPGEYKVIAENKNGCKTEKTFTFSFLESPVAEIKILDESNICNSDSLILYAFPKGQQYSYKWFNNGSSADSLIIRNSGFFTLTVLNKNGCSDTASLNIQLGTGLPVNIGGNKNVCEGENLVLTANTGITANESNLTYLWSTGEKTKSIIVSNAGLYSVVVTHISGCIGYDTVKTRFFKIPDLKLNYTSPMKICRDTEVILSPDTIHSELFYYWNDNNFEIPRKITESGTYKLFAVNAGICTDSTEIEIQIVDLPEFKIIAEGGTKLCTGETLKLKSSVITDGYKYLWSDGNDKPEIEVSQAGKYFLTVENQSGCKSTDSILIELYENPIVELSLSSQYLCKGDSVTIFANGKFNTILWDNGSTASNLKVSKSGYYKVTVFSPEGCLVTDSILVSEFNDEIHVESKDIDFGTICANQIIEKISEIKNNSNIGIEIISVSSFQKPYFSIPENLIGKFIKPGSSEVFTIRFNPVTNGDFSEKLKIIYRHICLDSLEITIKGIGNFSSIISLPDIISKAGTTLCIPVYYKFDCIDTVNFTDSPFISLSFDADYFEPDSVTDGKITSNKIVNGKRFVDVQLNEITLTEKEGILTYICGKTMIGRDTATVLNFEKFDWIHKLQITKFDGSIKNESCVIDLRPIRYFKPTDFSINPNPVTNLLNVNVISEEKGIFVLELSNSAGLVVLKYKWERSEGGESIKDVTIPTENLPSGVYNLILISPWHINSSAVIIVK